MNELRSRIVLVNSCNTRPAAVGIEIVLCRTPVESKFSLYTNLTLINSVKTIICRTESCRHRAYGQSSLGHEICLALLQSSFRRIISFHFGYSSSKCFMAAVYGQSDSGCLRPPNSFAFICGQQSTVQVISRGWKSTWL